MWSNSLPKEQMLCCIPLCDLTPRDGFLAKKIAFPLSGTSQSCFILQISSSSGKQGALEVTWYFPTVNENVLISFFGENFFFSLASFNITFQWKLNAFFFLIFLLPFPPVPLTSLQYYCRRYLHFNTKSPWERPHLVIPVLVAWDQKMKALKACCVVTDQPLQPAGHAELSPHEPSRGLTFRPAICPGWVQHITAVVNFLSRGVLHSVCSRSGSQGQLF